MMHSVKMTECGIPGFCHAQLWRVEPGVLTLVHIELTDTQTLGVDYLVGLMEKDRRRGMKSVIAMKIRGQWQQAELTIEVARGILKHDTAFEEIMFIENGELKKLVKPEPVESSESPPETTEAQPSTPQ